VRKDAEMKNPENVLTAQKKHSLARQLRKLMTTTLIPMLLLIVTTFAAFLVCNYQYKKVSGNITMASGFSQDFKNDIDLKMYYYATGSEYATGLPTKDVEAALTLARNLQERTNNRDSEKAITVLTSDKYTHHYPKSSPGCF